MNGFVEFILALVAVFAIGMVIRYFITKSKSSNPASAPPPPAAPPSVSNFCPQCRTPVPQGAGFCSNCGAKLS